MARLTVEDCLKEIDNRFALVIITARRTKQLLKGSKPLIEKPKNKPIIISLREVAAGKVRLVGDIYMGPPTERIGDRK